MTTFVLIVGAVVAGWAVDRFAFHGEFVEMAMTEMRTLGTRRRRPAPGDKPKRERGTFGRR